MKLEVRMYIRTKKGIYKINDFINNAYTQKFTYVDNLGVSNFLDKNQVVKASHNIIDLIEVGDYVNGSEVMEADWINENGEYEEGLAFPMYASDDLEVIENWLPLRCVDIKSIVTKEQFESIKYSLEG